MNKTLGSTLITSGTMIGAGMLAMPLTSAGIGFTFTVVLLVLLWILLTYSALLFVEVYQTAEHDAGIGTLAAQYFGRPGRIVATSVLMIFLYALLSAYVTGGGAILASTLPDFATPDLKMKGSTLEIRSWYLRGNWHKLCGCLKSFLIYRDDCGFIYCAWIDDSRN